MGVDGLRLDADAVSGRARRHQPARTCRRRTTVIARNPRDLDADTPGRVLLAEANQWPEDVRAYFGDGDECHMAFHFPLMPRMFMALRAGGPSSRSARSSRRRRTFPTNCQWAMFLRNHDELTLEMVTDEERDYMCLDLRRRSADAHQRRHPPPAGAADGQRPAARSS